MKRVPLASLLFCSISSFLYMFRSIVWVVARRMSIVIASTVLHHLFLYFADGPCVLIPTNNLIHYSSFLLGNRGWWSSFVFIYFLSFRLCSCSCPGYAPSNGFFLHLIDGATAIFQPLFSLSLHFFVWCMMICSVQWILSTCWMPCRPLRVHCACTGLVVVHHRPFIVHSSSCVHFTFLNFLGTSQLTYCSSSYLPSHHAPNATPKTKQNQNGTTQPEQRPNPLPCINGSKALS
jgi:hypothetical protein